MKDKMSRRNFMAWSALLGSGVLAGPKVEHAFGSVGASGKNNVISTWSHGLAANEAASQYLVTGKSAVDAVEAGVRVSEADPEVSSVGYGGLPDESGRVTLDASIMNSRGNAGAVGCLENIMHPISVARKVMEETDHVMLVGEGALEFAKLHGFKEENLLTDKARQIHLDWKARISDQDDWFPPGGEADHDTIGMVAQDERGDLAGACTTSGLRYKIRGRVGDSPIIGAGMYVDNEAGAAAATGRGEAVMKIAGSFLVVENMRRGASPKEAIEDALKRIIKQNGGRPEFQAAFVALNKKGEFGALSILQGFQYALFRNGENKLHDSDYLIS
ncbi:MAG: N(4)-(beta-N-acetylglucosaminyl)-L-asparaginase [Candidatus Latescibacterota bacterium]